MVQTNKYQSLLLLLFAILFIGYGSNKVSSFYTMKPTDEQKNYPILSDGSGYYAYLPQWFIYKTDNFEFIHEIEEKYPESRFGEGLNYNPDGKITDKYFIGTPILTAPSFLIAHFLATTLQLDNDGYSFVYQWAVIINSFIFFLLGAWAMFRLLGMYNISFHWRLLSIFAFGWGTNLSYFTFFGASFSHVYSFAFIAPFLYSLHKWRLENNSYKKLPVLAFYLGMIVLIRPTDGLIGLLIPFFIHDFKNWKEVFFGLFSKKGRNWFLTAVLIFVTLIGLQFLNTYQQTGSFSFNNYSEESFDFWKNPQIFNVLFSFRKGLFIFSPLLLLSSIGFYFLWKKDKTLTLGIFIFLVLFTYVTAAWWCWWYGGGLGMRPFINVFAIFMLPFALVLQEAKRLLKIGVLVFTFGFMGLYQVYEYQYTHNILHYDNMSFADFKKVFLQTDKRFEWALHREYDVLPTEKAEREHKEIIINQDRSYFSDYFSLDSMLKINIIPDTIFSKWGGEITGVAHIFEPQQNPYFLVQYFNRNALVHETTRSFGSDIPTLHKDYKVTIPFYPNFELTTYDSIAISFFPHGIDCYFKDVQFKSFYWK